MEGAAGGGDMFVVDDLLDFPNEEDAILTDVINDDGGGNIDNVVNVNGDNPCGALDNVNGVVNYNMESPSAFFVDSSCNSSSCGEPPLAYNNALVGTELCVPYDDLAELEWVSNFVEESFSTDDLQKLHMISGLKIQPEESRETPPDPQHYNINTNISVTETTANNYNNNSPIFQHDVSVPAKARSKRSRAAPCNWESRLFVLSAPSNSDKKPRKRDIGVEANNEGRKCLHCATEKTPQWRTGPMGPKTLCNACGVRYKSGRLVPEYRPAASPTFVLTKHSNSHRKVLELRRQKEMVRAQQQLHHQQQQFLHHQNLMFDHHVSNGDDYLIHRHMGPDFRQLI